MIFIDATLTFIDVEGRGGNRALYMVSDLRSISPASARRWQLGHNAIRFSKLCSRHCAHGIM